MPKFYLVSDIHLEGGVATIVNPGNVDCLILAGDVVEFRLLRKSNTNPKLQYIREFFEIVSREFQHVLWIPGNHEYWRSWGMEYSLTRAREWLTEHNFHNIHLVNNQTVEIQGTPVHCSTLWTDYRKHDPIALWSVAQQMNDYRFIRGVTPARNGSRVKPTEIYEVHKASLRYLENAVSDGKPCVVVTHHHPLMQTLNSERACDLDYAFGSDLSNFILDNPNITTWCCGHSHGRIVFPIGDQRVLCNCRGYIQWEPTLVNTFSPMIFDV